LAVALPLVSAFFYTNARAQQSDEYITKLKIDLNAVSKYYDETIRISPTDTLGVGRVDRIPLGAHYYVPNPLYNIYPRSEFERYSELTEYPLETGYQVKLRYPNIAPFGFKQEREGSFIVLQPRDLDQATISIESIDRLAEERRVTTLHNVWRQTVIDAINSQQEKKQTSKGLLNVSIPVDLPDAVERIIGEGEATNIEISGRESIEFAGETRRVSPYIGVEGQQSQPLFPSLDMKQELDVRLQGQIGEKINIQVDHSSQAVANQNRIRLNYTGFEDDIIQLIELGNTSLSLPGSQLVSFSGGSQGLFGIKALAQVGALDLTMIASKEQGEASRASFRPSGGQIGQTETRVIADINYIKNIYFFFDDPRPPADRFFLPQTASIEVWQSVPSVLVQDANVKRARAWLDQSGRGDDIRAGIDSLEAGIGNPQFRLRSFQLLNFPQDYSYVVSSGSSDVVIGIELTSPVPENEILAVRYVNSLGDTIGDLDNNIGTEEVPLNLELIKDANQKPEGIFGPAWFYMMRHIYNLGLTNIDRNSFEIQILENALRQDPSRPDSSAVPWLRIFGLDQTGDNGIGPPDDRIDLSTGLIDLNRGILTFPILRPWDPPADSVAKWTDGQFAFTGKYADLKNPALYDEYLSIPSDYQKFTIEVQAASTSRTFFIDAFDITEGSEIVTVDGQILVRNQDYTINYETGEVELQGDIIDRLTPSSNITIDYEYTPIAGGGSTTLMGFNSDYKWSDRATLATTWLYESKSSSTNRPRLGEEPTRAVVGDIRGNFQANPRFLTSIANLLPLVDTDAPSAFSLAGEMAMSFPDPNTAGEVYIDDFEGIEDSDIFSLSRRSWRPASPPVDPANPAGPDATLDSGKNERIFWYNVEPDQGVNRRDLNPDLDEREATLVPTIDLEFDTVTTDSTHWAGIMQGFRGGGLDLTQAQFIEIWVNDFKKNPADRGGKLHVDLGFIDEDFYRPDEDEYNTEDANFDGFNALTEDTGLDSIFGEDGLNVPGDDGDDDFVVNRINGRFTKINGTENNRQLDTEDIDGSGDMEKLNAYWSFDVDLTEEAETDIRRDFPNYTDFNDPDESWRRYRIDLASAQLRSPLGGQPLLSQVTHLRVWIDDIPVVINPSKKRLQIAGFKVVGNRWQQDGIRSLDDQPKSPASGRFALGVISTKTDAARYIPPIAPNTVNDITDKEQSLLVTYTELDSGEVFRVRKRFTGRGLNFTNYRDLNFFVHTDTITPDLEYYFRVAFDSLNYYEINLPMTQEYFPDKDNNWARVLVKMNDITDLKFEPADSVVSGIIPDHANEGRSYVVRMVGRPSLFNVRFFYAGVRNKGSTKTEGLRELWMNDIYLGDRKRDVDSAQRLSTSINLGNVINLNGQWRRTGPDFRGLRQARGSGTEQQSISLNAKTSVEHFVPTIGFRIPVSGTYSRDVALPKFTPSSDTEISQPALKDSLRTEAVSRGLSATLTRQGSKNPLFRYSFDKLKLNYSLSDTRRRAPTSRDTSLTMAGTADYSITWGQGPRVRLFRKMFWRWWLNSFNFRVNANRTTGQTWTLVGNGFQRRPGRYNSKINVNGSVSYIPFPSLSMNFRAQQQRDRVLEQFFQGINIGREINRSQNIQANYKPPPIWLIGAFSPDLSFTSSYREDSSPNVRRPGDPVTVRNASNARDTSLKLRFDLGKYLKRFFKVVHLQEDEKAKEAPPPPPRGAGGGGGPGATPGGTGGSDAQADTTQAEPEKGPDRMILFKKIATALGNIRRINASARQQFNSQYDRIPERPSLMYQFGLTEKAGVLDDGEFLNKPLTQRTSLNVSFDTGTQITENIDVAVRFTRTQDQTESRGNITESTTMTWPDLNLSWKGIEKYGPFRGLFATTSATLSYRASKREAGQPGRVDQTTEDRQINPAMVFAWKNGLSSSLSGTLSRNLSDTRGSVTQTNNVTIGLDMKYSFSAGKALKLPIPGLRNKILKSKLDTSMNISYSKRSGKRSTGSLAFFEPIPGTNQFRVSPRLTYNFTRALNGSFFIDYSRSFSEATNQTTTLVRVGLNATFTF